MAFEFNGIDLKIAFNFFAKNPPSILILAGIFGWLLCGFTGIPVFCQNWSNFVLVGIALQLLWMSFKYKLGRL